MPEVFRYQPPKPVPNKSYQYAKSIGIGGIAMAGIIGIFKSRKIIMGLWVWLHKK